MIVPPPGSVSATQPPLRHMKSKLRVAEQVVVVEQALGRRLGPGEIVHHVDGDKLNNHQSNLLVCSRSYHNWLHSRMSYLYQREHFAQAG